MKHTLVFGIHAVEAILNRSPDRILDLMFEANRQDKRLIKLRELSKTAGLSFQECKRFTLNQMTDDGVHQGVIARIRYKPPMGELELFNFLKNIDQPLLLILDGVQDPRNLGACLRTADAAGVDAVVMAKHDSAELTAVARKAASGAADTIPIARVSNLARTMNKLKDSGIWLLGADEIAGDEFHQAKLDGSIGLVVGGEGSGLRKLTKQHCDHMIRIPMLGSVSSINVSVATGILLYEVVRQRKIVG